ncbi:MAG: hypothetical protein ABR907_08290 [Terracidiphilus sp.]
MRELDADKDSLTEMAQQVLRDEMKKRGLDGPPAARQAPDNAPRIAASQPGTGVDFLTVNGESESASLPREYTWKTLLCECEEVEEAWQLREMLKLAGIESWIEGVRYFEGSYIGTAQVKVAADQLDEAREVAARPVPQAIVEQCKIVDDEFDLPVCPTCGAEDPVLESADPVNAWLCEACGKQWKDPAEG